MNNLQDYSIFSLLKDLDNTNSQKELEKRYNDYSLLENCNQVFKESSVRVFLNKFFKMVNDKNINVEFFENYSEKIIFPFSILDSFQDRMSDIVSQTNFIESLIELFKKCHTFSSIYLTFYFAYFISKERINAELKNLMMIFAKSIFFSYHAIYLLRYEKNYPQLHHETYYKFKSKNKSLVNFYREFPDRFDSSLYYDLLNNNYYPEQKNSFRDFCLEEQEKFIKILSKYANAKDFESYNTTINCIKEFDDFFNEQNNCVTYVDLLFDELQSNDDSQTRYVEIILLLLTRSKSYSTIKFAISLIHFFTFSNEYKKELFDDLENLARYKELTRYCCFSLKIADNSQVIFRRMFRKYAPSIKLELLEFLDLSDKKNFFLAIEKTSKIAPRINSLVYLLTNSNISKIVNSSLTQKEIDLISAFLSRCLIYNSKKIIPEFNDFPFVIKDFYNNYYDKITNIHLLNIAILEYYVSPSNTIEKEIVNFINNKIVYEDELTYIDECLAKKDFNIDEISIMMNYYHYYSSQTIKQLIFENYHKFFPLVLNLDIENDENDIDEILNFMEQNFIINKKYLSIENSDLYKEKNCQECYFLILILDLLSVTFCYVPKIFSYGLTIFDSKIRFAYYNHLIGLYSLTRDNNVFDMIEYYSKSETNEKILKIINGFFLENKKLIS